MPKYLVETFSLQTKDVTLHLKHELACAAKNIQARLFALPKAVIVPLDNILPLDVSSYFENKEGEIKQVEVGGIWYLLHSWIPNKGRGGYTTQFELSLTYKIAK